MNNNHIINLRFKWVCDNWLVYIFKQPTKQTNKHASDQIIQEVIHTVCCKKYKLINSSQQNVCGVAISSIVIKILISSGLNFTAYYHWIKKNNDNNGRASGKCNTEQTFLTQWYTVMLSLMQNTLVFCPFTQCSLGKNVLFYSVIKSQLTSKKKWKCGYLLPPWLTGRDYGTN